MPVKPVKSNVETFAGRSVLSPRMRPVKKRKAMKKMKFQNATAVGFTMVEILIVVVILAVAAMIVVPTLSSAADMQVRSAANSIAADLDYARGLAITRQKNYTVVFDSGAESYEIWDETAGELIKNPLTNQNFTVDIDADSRLRQVDINSADFDGDVSITFNYLGAPFDSGGGTMDVGTITIQDKSAAFKLYVHVEAATGYVTIDDAP
jgi:prepilin-type N-terminal cleavage/methylation domain-containing protein